MNKTLLCILTFGFIGCNSDINIENNPNDIIKKDLSYRKKNIISITYNKKYKAPVIVSYKVSPLSNTKNIFVDRPSFYIDKELQKDIRASNSDYTDSGMERGHLASHASFDFSKGLLNLTYCLSNIVPQYPKVNKKTWIKAERFERAMCKFGSVRVNNYAIYGKRPKRIGKNKISVPKALIKEIIIDGESLCFYFKNIKNPNTKAGLFEHKIDCNRIKEYKN